MDLGDPVLEPSALDVILNLAITQSAFKSHQLPLLKGLGEFGEIAPGKDAVPFGAGFVLALVVLPAFLGCDVEDEVCALVSWSGAGIGLKTGTPTADQIRNAVRQIFHDPSYRERAETLGARIAKTDALKTIAEIVEVVASKGRIAMTTESADARTVVSQLALELRENGAVFKH
jgi:hypothetical protein